MQFLAYNLFIFSTNGYIKYNEKHANELLNAAKEVMDSSQLLQAARNLQTYLSRISGLENQMKKLEEMFIS